MQETEIAWAAGLFDGEGCSYYYERPNGERCYGYLGVTMTQQHPEVLERFSAAVGIGRVYGPSLRKAGKPMWQYTVYNAKGIACIAILSPFLGTVKREQASLAIERFHNRPNQRKSFK